MDRLGQIKTVLVIILYLELGVCLHEMLITTKNDAKVNRKLNAQLHTNKSNANKLLKCKFNNLR